MENYKVLTQNFETREFNSFKDCCEFAIKNKGMVYVNRNENWVKHSNWSELTVPNTVEKNGYKYTERAGCKLYKCNKCGKINIVVNMQIMYCQHCNGGLQEVKYD